MTLPSDLDRLAVPIAVALALAIAVVSALAGHHLGVSQGIGEAASIRDEARVTRDACHEVLEWSDVALRSVLVAQQTFREVRAKRMEAMIETPAMTEDR